MRGNNLSRWKSRIFRSVPYFMQGELDFTKFWIRGVIMSCNLGQDFWIGNTICRMDSYGTFMVTVVLASPNLFLGSIPFKIEQISTFANHGTILTRGQGDDRVRSRILD